MSERIQDKSLQESEKLREKKESAKDIGNVIATTAACTATDFIDPLFGDFIQRRLGNDSQLKGNFIAEFAGDYGALPVTVAVRRMFPEFMNFLEKITSPLIDMFFHKSAEKDAQLWANKHGFTPESLEYRKRLQEILGYEKRHFPDTLVWTVSSVAINVATQRGLGNKAPIAHITAGKVGGAALTALLTTVLRGLFPRKAEKFEEFIGDNIVIPVQNFVNNLFGSDDLEDKSEKYQKIETEKRLAKQYSKER